MGTVRYTRLIVSSLLSIASCQGSAPTSTTGATTGTTTGTNTGTTTTGTASVDASAIYTGFGGSGVVTRDGGTVVITSTNIPDHKSPYFQPADPRYEAYNGTNPQFALNPNRIADQSLVYRIPSAPAPAATVAATPLGPIGVTVNGVAIFNQYAGPNQPLTNEINSFDQYGGHPQQSGQYHYHVEPLWITAKVGKSGLIGVLLDGFPVYGPVENGKVLVTADLDALHGHFGATAQFPNGIYHYHVTADSPYINGSGFKGTPGTVGR
jgi:hypothetical protein